LDNPFEKYDLDPREGIGAITQRLRELAEEAKTDEERERIRAAWEELTLHPARRLRAALNAVPETRAALGSPPPLPRLRVAKAELELRDLAARPSVSAAVSSLPEAGKGGAEDEAAPSLDDDPHF
jgi:hypothetical protein